MRSLTVVVPTFNEVDNVAVLVEQLNAELVGIDAEVLFVDDSTDDTPAVIRRVATVSALPVRVLHRSTPQGRLAGAVLAGIAAAPWVVVMDGDLQHPPAVVPVLHRQALLGGADVVVASRYMSGGDAGGLDSPFRHLVSTGAGRCAKVLFPRRLAGCSDPMSGFFAVRRAAVQPAEVARSGYKILLALLVHRPLSVSEVPFVFAARHAGRSKASLLEGLRFLRLLAVLRTGPGLLFSLVGASGVLPNLAAVALLTRAGVHYLVAAAVGTQLAIVWNFAGAELVVFRDRRAGRLWTRAVRYVALSETDLARLPFVALLVHYLHASSVAASAITLLAAVALRYSLAARLVYGPGTAAVLAATSRGPR